MVQRKRGNKRMRCVVVWFVMRVLDLTARGEAATKLRRPQSSKQRKRCPVRAVELYTTLAHALDTHAHARTGHTRTLTGHTRTRTGHTSTHEHMHVIIHVMVELLCSTSKEIIDRRTTGHDCSSSDSADMYAK